VNTSASASSTRTRCTDAGWGDASDPVREAGEAAATLRERYDELARIEARIADLGRDRIETAADAYRRAHRVLDQYEEDAVGTGDFGSYVQFRGVRRGGRRRRRRARGRRRVRRCGRCGRQTPALETDFAAARDALEPAGNYVDLLADRDEALDDYRAARKAAREARKALDARLDDLREVAGMADADLDADVDRLREPIESYNDATRVREAFDSFINRRRPETCFSFLDRADGTPFVDADVPPTDLREYVTDYDAGEEPLPTLLEYADYSNSKLEHYVDDPGALRTAVAVHRTYVERLDAEPLTLDWRRRRAATSWPTRSTS